MPELNAIAIHPLPDNLENLKACIQACHPETVVHAFRDPLLAIQFALNNPVASVYTVVGMNRLNGFEVVRMVRNWHPQAVMNFVDQSDSSRRDAERMAIRTYLVEPVTVEQMRLAEAAAAAAEEGWSSEL